MSTTITFSSLQGSLVASSNNHDFLSGTPSTVPHRLNTSHPSSPPPHLILLAYPAQGHLIPLFNLAKLLASKGIAITFVCVEHRIAKLLRDHAGAAASGDPLIRLVGLPDRVPFGEYGIDEGVGVAAWTNEVVAHMEDDFVQLLNNLRSRGAAGPAMASMSHYGDENFSEKPIAIIHDSFVGWAIDLAARLNMKAHVFFTSSATSLSVLLHLPGLMSQGYVPLRLTSHGEPRPLITLPGLEPTPDIELLHFLRDHLPQDGVQPAVNVAFKLNEASSILVNSFYELESSAIDALQNYQNLHRQPIRIRTLGPVLPLWLTEANRYSQGDLPQKVQVVDELNSRNYEENRCLIWLESQSTASVVYVSFGTIFIPSVEDMRELALGLENSHHAFLWVVRLPRQASRDDSLCLSKILPEGFEARTRDRGLIITHWAPQLSILSHPATAAFLTHCGWNSTIESMFMGVPMIACPQFAEQETNCRLIVRQWKIGIALENNVNGTNFSFRRKEVERAVRIVMEGEQGKQIKTNVRRLRERTRSALKEGGSSSTTLHEFVQDLF